MAPAAYARTADYSGGVIPFRPSGKTEYYLNMAEEAAKHITGSREQWTSFLSTAARIYKYPYQEQLMIFTQRPDATACADYDLWNKTMHRYVRRGSKGIALVDNSGRYPRLRYVFDVSDTGARENSRPVQLWKMSDEYLPSVQDALERAYGVSASLDFPSQIEAVASKLAAEYWDEKKEQILDIVDDSFLYGYDEFNVSVSFRRAAEASIKYMLYTRCVDDPDSYFEPEDFMDVFDFNTQEASNALGTAVSMVSSQVFREVERAIRIYDRAKTEELNERPVTAERGKDNGRTDLHAGGRSISPEHRAGGDGGQAAGQVRQDEEDLSGGEQRAAVQSPVPDREAVPAPVGDPGHGDREDTQDNGRDAESRPGTGQDERPDGLGAAHERPESTGRGDRDSGTYNQLSIFSLFPSEQQQIQTIDSLTAETPAQRAESDKKPSAFSISEKEIEKVMQGGSGFEGGKMRIMALYAQEGDPKRRADYLRREYGTGGRSWEFSDGSRGYVDFSSRGMLIRSYDHNKEQFRRWDSVDKAIGRLVESGQYLTDAEKARYADLEESYALMGGIPLPSPGHAFAPTPEKIYEQYLPVLREKVMADGAYRNACVNSGKDMAQMEGANAIEKAALSIDDPLFAKVYFDIPEYHDRFHEVILTTTYDALAVNPDLAANPDVADMMAQAVRSSNDGELAAPERFSVIETEGGYAVWDETREEIYVDREGVSEEFASEWQAQDYLEQVKKEVSEQEAADWLKVEQAKSDAAVEGSTDKGASELTADDISNIHLVSSEYHRGDRETEYRFSCEIKGEPDEITYTVSQHDDGEHFTIHSGKDDIWGRMAGRELEKLDGILGRAAEFGIWETRIAGAADAERLRDVELGFQEAENINLSDEQKIGIWKLIEARQDALREQETAQVQGELDLDGGGADNSTSEIESPEISANARDSANNPRLEQAKDGSEAEPAYQVGDTVYLDDKPFVVEGIGMFDVTLRDPSLLYPIFRAENKERFEQMLRADERNAQFLPDAQADVAAPNYEITLSADKAAALERQMHEAGIDSARSVHENGNVTFSFSENDRDAVDRLAEGLTSVQVEQKSGMGEAHVTGSTVYPGDRNGLPFDVVVETISFSGPQHEPSRETADPQGEQASAIPVQNFRITDDHLGAGGQKAKFRANMDAIYTLQQIEAEGRNATPEEQEILSRYVGWGGLPDAFEEKKEGWSAEYAELKAALTPEEYSAARGSTLNAHYTSPTVIKAIYDAVGQMGFESGNILEPSMGVGNFFGLLPENMQGSRLYGVELDSITGRIARKLYPNADITVAGFETTDRRDFYDLAVGNVPFGNYKVNDRPYNKLGFSIHNYFFAKALDQVRPGGMVAFVTSRFTMDAKNPEARKYIAQRAELLGAIRLPNNAFKENAGTEVVSDILFLQKRDRPIDIEPDWVHLGQTDDGLAVNSYFVDHPEMVLGRLTAESTMYGRDDITVEAIPGADLSDQLREAVSHIQGQYQAVQIDEEELDEGAAPSGRAVIPADPSVKNYSYAVIGGEVYFRENSIMKPVDLSETAKGRVLGMIGLRQIVGELIEYQLQDYPDEEIVSKQRELNIAYDAFYEKYGTINSSANARVFDEDSSYYLLCSLEDVDDNGRLIGKADMFSRRTIRPERHVTSVDTPSEALAVSIGERGRVDLQFMSELLGTPGDFDRTVSELHGVIFRDPMQASADDVTKGWHTADDYLSGNVREKLRIAQMAAQTDPSFRINVAALEKAQPKDLEASEIDVRLGATWIKPEYIQQFMIETFETPWRSRRAVQVQYSPQTAEWQISGKTVTGRHDVMAYMTYGTDRANAYRILEDTLNLRDVRIYDTVEDVDGKQKRVLNKKETTLAQQKQQAIKDAFRDWVWRDPRRRADLVQTYNELFNSTRPREYDGSHIVFGGMNPDITLREHQRGAIAHVLYGGNTLLAHEVGAGKTFEMAASAMEAKRLGLCQKSLFVVPNHLTLQWASEFLRLYPSAKILVASKKDFETARRKKFCARIATGDYDAIIIGHSQFEKIPMSAERQERILQEQIDDITGAIAEAKAMRGENFTIKQLEKTRKSLQARLDKLQGSERKDDVVTFEQLGVDRLFVDEAHSFKNLFLYTKMRNVAGLSTSEAQKSSDMFMKCQYMDEITGGKGTVFATGTPVSNSMTELYTMMRYLQYGTLQQKGLTHFDQWASTFGETTTAIELAPEGYTLVGR